MPRNEVGVILTIAEAEEVLAALTVFADHQRERRQIHQRTGNAEQIARCDEHIALAGEAHRNIRTVYFAARDRT